MMIVPLLALGGLGWWLFGPAKPKANGPELLAKTTSELGQPDVSLNYLAASGRVYRYALWKDASRGLILGGSWAAQPNLPNALLAFDVSDPGTPFMVLASVYPDATAESDLRDFALQLSNNWFPRVA